MLQYNSQAPSCFCELVDDTLTLSNLMLADRSMLHTFLQIRQTIISSVFARTENIYRSSSFVVGRVKPVAHVVRTVGMWLITCLVLEVVDRNGEVVGWVQRGRVNVVAVRRFRDLFAISKERNLRKYRSAHQ